MFHATKKDKWTGVLKTKYNYLLEVNKISEINNTQNVVNI